MKINFLTIILLTSTLFVASFGHAQERSADSNPSKNLDHPAHYADPSIVPFESEVVPSNLSIGSRQVQEKQQRVVASIVQRPDGELKFVLLPGVAGGVSPLSNNSRQVERAAGVAASDELPSSESEDFRKPEGFSSDETESVAEEGAKNGSDLSSVSPPAKFSRDELLKIDEQKPVPFGHVFQMPDGTVYTTEDTEKNTEKETPAELAAGSRVPSDPPTDLKDVGAHSHGNYNAVGDKIVFIATEWSGSFLADTADNAFKQAIKQRKLKGNTAVEMTQAKTMGGRADGCQIHKLAPDRHMVIGWYNVDRNEYQWHAIEITSRRSFRFITADGVKGEQINGTGDNWKAPITMTNGQRIKTQFAVDNCGGLLWRFEILK